MPLFALALLIVLAGLWGCSEQEPSGTNSPSTASPSVQGEPADQAVMFDKESILKPYQPLKPALDKPMLIDAATWTLCIMRSPREVAEDKKRRGPHTSMYGMFYMNESAERTLRGSDEEASYPVGSVIIKEKLDLVPDQSPLTTGLAGMIKREAGYDPDHGNWEYFIVDDITPMRRGKLESCITCHTKVASSDYVFGIWSR